MATQDRSACGVAFASMPTPLLEADMPRPKFRLACCLCRKPIPLASDAYALDDEWKRRFPQMVGRIACEACALRNHVWQCRTHGGFVDGHIPITRPGSDHDSWDHFLAYGTHISMVVSYPESTLLQGAEEYLRYTARRSGIDPEVARQLHDALDAWDAGTGTTTGETE
jgi:hypothetical protein